MSSCSHVWSVGINLKGLMVEILFGIYHKSQAPSPKPGVRKFKSLIIYYNGARVYGFQVFGGLNEFFFGIRLYYKNTNINQYIN